MSSLIEQAAKRLEELRRAGIEIPPLNGVGAGRFAADPGLDDRQAGPAPARATAARDRAEVESSPRPASGGDASPRSISLPDGNEVILFDEPVLAPRPRRHLDIDLVRLAAMGYLVPAQAQTLLADLLRVIKRPLLQNMRRPPELGGPARHGNVVVVTSAVPGEGKTFVATNLAMSIAMEVDHAALLIDGDVLRPAVFNRLGLEPKTGLMDALLDSSVCVTDLIVGTNVPKLTLLSAGTAHDRAEELLASASMDRLVDQLSVLYSDRLIIIDSPPLLVTTESRALAERAGQVVLVVEADRTPREQISRAFDTLSNCPIVLSVLNRSRAIESDYVYGY
jgi:protein-tyrosine kinase